MHQPSGGIGGTASDIRIQAEQMLYIKRTLAERIAFHTGQTVEQIETDSDRDRWFTAEEAKDYGFVDHVVRSATRSRRRAGLMNLGSRSGGTAREHIRRQPARPRTPGCRPRRRPVTSCRPSWSGPRTGSRR